MVPLYFSLDTVATPPQLHVTVTGEIDVKGDLPNLALAFSSLDRNAMAPWVEPAPGDDETSHDRAGPHGRGRAAGRPKF